MNKIFWLVGALVLLSGTFACHAEEFILFSASASGASAWANDNARIAQKDKALVVTEDNRTGSFGSVYLTRMLPFLAEGAIDVDVKQVVAGNYSVQVLGFQGTKHIHTSDLVESSNKPAKKKLPLKFMGFPPETDSVMLKIWVTDIEGACVRVSDIRYVLDVAPEKIGLDDVFATAGEWKADACSWTPTLDGARLSLPPGKNSGSLERAHHVKKPADGLMFFQAPEVVNGSLTVQVVAFDAQGSYLESLDAIAGAGAGEHSVRLNNLKWPENAAEFSIKIWLNGSANSSALVKRLAIVDL
jgi:hypothetical protein